MLFVAFDLNLWNVGVKQWCFAQMYVVCTKWT